MEHQHQHQHQHNHDGDHGTMFGHVLPGLFYLVTGFVLLFVARNNFKGPTSFKLSFGVVILSMATIGILVEGIGGVLFIGDFFFQLAHECMYASFLLVGLTALLESMSRLPFDSWRLVMSIALFVEGLIFYGHALAQPGLGGELHFVLSLSSVFAADAFLLSAIYPNNNDLHVLSCSGLVLKGVWFIVIAHILYSGVYGKNGANMMAGDVYIYAGLSILFVLSMIGSLIYLRKSGSYEFIERF